MIVFLCCLLLGLLYYYSTKTHDYWKKRNVKYYYPLPLFGNNFRNQFGIKSTTEISIECYKDFPNEKVVGYFRGSTPELVVRDIDIAKEILNAGFPYNYKRGLGRNPEVESLLYNLFHVEGDIWKLLRQRLTPTFTTAKLKGMFPLIIDCAAKLQNLGADIASNGGDCDIRELMARFTTEFIGACGFGIEMSTISDEHSLFRDLGKKIFNRRLKNIVAFIAWELFPFLRNYIYVADRSVEDTLTSIVEKIRYQRNYKPIGRNDFIDLLLELEGKGTIKGESIEKRNPDGSVVEIELDMTLKLMVAQVFVFFAAGFETSSSATSFTLHQLAYHPELQVTVQREIDDVLSKYNNKLCYDAVAEMKLLDCAFKESMRMFPSLGVLNRECTRRYTLPGLDVTIDPGVKIIIPLQAIQNDEKYFENPNEYKPERFATKHAKYNQVYMPFGQGPRACIDSLQKLGYRVDLIPVDFVNYCMMEVCGFEIFRCNITNLLFNTPCHSDPVCKRAIAAIQEATAKFSRARTYFWFLNLLWDQIFKRNEFAPQNHWPTDIEHKEFSSCSECIKCCKILTRNKCD